MCPMSWAHIGTPPPPPAVNGFFAYWMDGWMDGWILCNTYLMGISGITHAQCSLVLADAPLVLPSLVIPGTPWTPLLLNILK